MQTRHLVFAVDPLPKNGARFGNGRAYRSAKVERFTRLINGLAKMQWEGEPWDCPLKVVLKFHIKRPWSVKRKLPAVKPDLDNLEKALWDALEGVVFTNDSRIVDKTVSKRYSNEGQIEISIKKAR